MLGPDDLVLCAGTLARASFRERCEAAVAGGFRGISLFGSDYRAAREAGFFDAEMRALLADSGLEVAELDPLMTWLPGVEAGMTMFEASEQEFYDIAAALGARSINAIVFALKPVPRDEVVLHFGSLCDRAAERGLLVHLEFMPWTQVADAEAAWEVVRLADRPNGGIMFDTWHHFRGSVADGDLARKIPIERIFAVQLNDAPAAAEEDVVAETLNRRRLPGDGDIDLPALLRILREGGSPAPLGVEVFCEDLFELDPNEVGRRAGDATRAAIAASHHG